MTDRLAEIAERWRLGNDEHADADIQYLIDQIAERDMEIREDKRLMLNMVAEKQGLEVEIAALAEAAGPCSSGRDGECYGDNCPQEHDDRKNYRSYCPRARYWEAKQEDEV